MTAGAHVSVIMTPGAHRFVGPTTFSALSSEPVHTSLFDDGEPIPHTRLGQQADLIVVAPATARVIAGYAAGLSSDLLTATLIATRAPVVVCPAMHTEMWEHPSVQENLATLRRRGVIVVEPEPGRLAGGDVGHGRLAAPANIFQRVAEVLDTTGDLGGRRVLVTAGGTREPVDPVRFIGNRSSGRQGHAIAEAARARGATVTLVTTTDLAVSPGIDRVRVDTAEEMSTAVSAAADRADIIVMAAAVADFRVAEPGATKFKKADGAPRIELVPTTDILATLGASKRTDQILVGFAAETNDLERHATDKLRRKGLDLIVANDVSAPGVGFEHETNAVLVLSALGDRTAIPLTTKTAIANRILDLVRTYGEST